MRTSRRSRRPRSTSRTRRRHRWPRHVAEGSLDRLPGPRARWRDVARHSVHGRRLRRLQWIKALDEDVDDGLEATSREPQYAPLASARRLPRCTRSWPITFAITKRIIGSGQPPQPCSRRIGQHQQATLRAGRALAHASWRTRGAHRGKGRRAGLKAARDAFYRGDIAQKIARYHHENGGWVTRDDLASFEVRRADRDDHVPRHRAARVRTVVARPCATAGAQRLRGLRPESDEAQLGRLHPSRDRSAQARVRRSPSLLRRSAFVDVPIDALLSKDMRPLAVRCSRRTRRPRACRLPET